MCERAHCHIIDTFKQKTTWPRKKTDKKQRTKNKEQRTKNKEQRTKNKADRKKDTAESAVKRNLDQHQAATEVSITSPF